jgi:thioester reductase-like protein
MILGKPSDAHESPHAKSPAGEASYKPRTKLPTPLRLETLFLTGATGVLGARLLKELLLTSRAKLYCLVRGETEAQGRERLLSFLKVYDPDGELTEVFNSRVTPILGDVSQERLGLTQAQYDDLTRRVDGTLHVAANTNLFSNFRRIEPVNVGGSKNIIRFCLNTAQKYLCYVSTYTVSGSKIFDGDLVFKETDLDVGQTFENMTYQRSKFIAEGLIREASREGLIWNVMRPGQIFGESDTGRYPQGQTNVSGLFYDIFKTVIETQVGLLSNTHYDVVPVDYVSRSICYLAFHRNSFFETYHLTNPDIKTYTEVISLLKGLGYPLEIVSEKEYKRLLVERALRNALARMTAEHDPLHVEAEKPGSDYKSSTTKAFKWWYNQGFSFDASARTDCTYTQAVLEKAGIFCPKIDVKLLRTYIQAGVEAGYFPPAPHPSAIASSRSAKRDGHPVLHPQLSI